MLAISRDCIARNRARLSGHHKRRLFGGRSRPLAKRGETLYPFVIRATVLGINSVVGNSKRNDSNGG